MSVKQQIRNKAKTYFELVNDFVEEHTTAKEEYVKVSDVLAVVEAHQNSLRAHIKKFPVREDTFGEDCEIYKISEINEFLEGLEKLVDT